MLFKILILLSCAAFFIQNVKCKSPMLRIVGGEESTTRYEFLISLQTCREVKDENGTSTGRYQYFHRCGGTIVRHDCIVTAAHCVTNLSSSILSVFAGTNDLDDPSGERYFLRNFTIHPKYNVAYDIAVLRLNESMQFTDRIGPITLSKEFIGGGIKLRLPGWGLTDQRNEKPPPRKLQELNTTSMTNEECNKCVLYKPTETDICTIERDNGANSGDSGGPLILYRDDEAILGGLVSRGFMISAVPTFPDINARASLFVDWINEQCDKTDDKI